jgi:hypothetical protein
MDFVKCEICESIDQAQIKLLKIRADGKSYKGKKLILFDPSKQSMFPSDLLSRVSFEKCVNEGKKVGSLFAKSKRSKSQSSSLTPLQEEYFRLHFAVKEEEKYDIDLNKCFGTNVAFPARVFQVNHSIDSRLLINVLQTIERISCSGEDDLQSDRLVQHSLRKRARSPVASEGRNVKLKPTAQDEVFREEEDDPVDIINFPEIVQQEHFATVLSHKVEQNE